MVNMNNPFDKDLEHDPATKVRSREACKPYMEATRSAVGELGWKVSWASQCALILKKATAPCHIRVDPSTREFPRRMRIRFSPRPGAFEWVLNRVKSVARNPRTELRPGQCEMGGENRQCLDVFCPMDAIIHGEGIDAIGSAIKDYVVPFVKAVSTGGP